MLLDKILNNLKEYPKDICCKHDRYYTNKEFYEIVCKIYHRIKTLPKDRPIIVYGHKEVYMIASFLACSFLGIAYVPIDDSMNENRINYIIDVTNPSLIIGNFRNNKVDSLSFEEIKEIETFEDINDICMKKEDTYYIIFTSGTTGEPKGVMVSYENVDSCISWLANVLNISNEKYTIYNQAVFSFDLSVADIYLSLATNSNHYIGTDLDISNLKEKFDDLKNSNSNIMVLTPSYAQILCLDKRFDETLLPNLKQIVFCGEILSRKLVNQLYERFPKIKIINMYGPTECTYAVTSIEVLKNDDEIIPVGICKNDCNIYIVDDNKNILGDNIVGEILIAGKSVSKGCINDSNSEKFFIFNNERAYLTGDLGYIKNGVLYYVSRKDSQIKYKGYRIELLDIENNILKIDGVEAVKVNAVKDENGIVQRIIANIVLKQNSNKEEITNEIKNKLPNYMIPIIKYVDRISTNINGKLEL